jgi:hypothetical protein
MTAGMANSTMKEVASIAHAKIGIRSSDIPGARCLNMVQMISTETASAEISVKVIIWAQISMPFPGEYCVSLKGA